MVSLTVSCYGGLKALERTIKSVEKVCDEVICVSHAFFSEEAKGIEKIADKTVPLKFGSVIGLGDGFCQQHGAYYAKNNWCLCLGVGEIVAEGHERILKELKDCNPKNIYSCNHSSNPHVWKRIWNTKEGGTFWSGIIHAEIVNGIDAGVLFRMEDTEKDYYEDEVKREAFIYYKCLSFYYRYKKLYSIPDLLEGTNKGWLDFVKENIENIDLYLENQKDLLVSILDNDSDAFLSGVRLRLKKGIKAPILTRNLGVSFVPTGDESEMKYVGHPE